MLRRLDPSKGSISLGNTSFLFTKWSKSLMVMLFISSGSLTKMTGVMPSMKPTYLEIEICSSQCEEKFKQWHSNYITIRNILKEIPYSLHRMFGKLVCLTTINVITKLKGNDITVILLHKIIKLCDLLQKNLLYFCASIYIPIYFNFLQR